MRITPVNNNRQQSFGIRGICFKTNSAKTIFQRVFLDTSDQILSLSNYKPKKGKDTLLQVSEDTAGLIFRSDDGHSHLAAKRTPTGEIEMPKRLEDELNGFTAKVDDHRTDVQSA